MSAESELERRTESVPQWKQDEVEELSDFLEAYESIGIVGVTGIPSRQLQLMRAEIYGTAALRMSRNTLIERALSEANGGVEQLIDRVSGQVGLIGTNENPFTLYRRLEESKTPAPINAGEVAPNDIVIPAGDTGMDPGPFVGDLQSVGAAAQILEGSIKVTEESVVAEVGDIVSSELATVLAELGIEPKEVGLDLRGVYSDGVIFEPEDLAIDIEEYRTDFAAAGIRALNLSVELVYPTSRNAPSLLAKASSSAKSVGLHASIESPELIGDLVSRADAQVRSLVAKIGDDEAVPEELRGIDTPDSSPDETEESGSDSPEDTKTLDTASDEEPAENGDGSEDGDVSGEGLGDLFG